MTVSTSAYNDIVRIEFFKLIPLKHIRVYKYKYMLPFKAISLGDFTIVHNA